MGKPRILVVDDDRVVVEVLSSLLDDPDREIVTADCSAAALDHARAGELAVALVDKNLGADSGLDLSRQLKQLQPEVEVILITGYASIESAIEAVQIGAFDYLTKPIADFSALSFKVQSAMEKSHLRRQQHALLERLMECEVRHRRLIDAAPEAVVLYDGESGLVVEANEAALQLYGYSAEELLRAPAADLRGGAPEGKPGPAPLLQEHRRKDGSGFPAEVTFTEFRQQGRTLRVQSARDVSAREQGEGQRRELEDRLRASQKMDAIGRLAGGVAHDFSNLLAVISAHAEYLRSALDPQHALQQEIEGIARGAERGAQLTRQLLLFSRRAPGEAQLIDVNVVVGEAHKLVSRLLGENIRFELETAPGLWTARAHPDQVTQVVLNLAVNSRDAMPGGGRLTVRTANITFASPVRARSGDLKPGRYVRIQVEDTGDGMTEEVLRRLFEPFFTTKGPGKGTGLGLATVYGIAGGAGGGVDVLSRPQKGTVVAVYIPAVDGVPESVRPVDRAPARGRGERILVVEDEDSLRTMVRRMLAAHGYEVLDAPDAEQGMRAAEGHTLDLLLTDVGLPKTNGPDLARLLIERQPSLRVLYMSGYPLGAESGPSAPAPLIQKPFSPFVLLGEVRRVLDA
jgi:signal transduction histidine kinase